MNLISNVAVLLTCFNRKEKTLNCLDSFFEAKFPKDILFDIFLVDDCSTDGTSNAVLQKFKEVTIVQGNGNLFWAGGMRLAFKTAQEKKSYDGFLLLNDDVVLKNDFFKHILNTHNYCINKYNKGGVYTVSTIDKNSNAISYGGNLLTKGINNPRYILLNPTNFPQICHLTNANILYIHKNVIEEIGFFDQKFTHGFADYDFSLRAFKAEFPVYLSPSYGGFCEDDHGNNWSNSKILKERISYLKSPTGLSYHDFMFYVSRHFPNYKVLMYLKLWGRTIFPTLWKIKKYFKIMEIKKKLLEYPSIISAITAIYNLNSFFLISGRLNNSIIYKYSLLKKTRINILGKGNLVIIKPENRLNNCLIHIRGNNCKVKIESRCILANLEIWIEDNNGLIHIDNHTTIEGGHIASTEGRVVKIGKDCMFSHRIEIRNGDSHAIFDSTSNQRINPAKDVIIQDHVWLGSDVKVLKGSVIGKNSIVGTGSIVTGNLEPGSIYVGVPVKKVKSSIQWTRER